MDGARAGAAVPPPWLDELRFEPGPPFQAMGTHSLDVRDWLVVDDERESQLDEKRRLVAEARDVVVAHAPGSEEASREVLELVQRALGERRHERDERDAGELDTGDHPLVAAALRVQEDLVVLQRRDSRWTVTAGVVCFPTHWTIGDKLGNSLAEVHGPVAHYESELRERVDRFCERLAPERPVWRRNWFVSPTDLLHLPSFPAGVVIPHRIAEDGSPMWIRSERQTLRRLPRTDAIVFTIRVQLAPLGVLLARADVAERMLRLLRSWDETKRAYTSTGRILDSLETWLVDVTGAA
jgi:hypothetical protein